MKVSENPRPYGLDSLVLPHNLPVLQQRGEHRLRSGGGFGSFQDDGVLVPDTRPVDRLPAAEPPSLTPELPLRATPHLDYLRAQVDDGWVGDGGPYPEAVRNILQLPDRLLVEPPRCDESHLLATPDVELPPDLLDDLPEVASSGGGGVQPDPPELRTKNLEGLDRLRLLVPKRVYERNPG